MAGEPNLANYRPRVGMGVTPPVAPMPVATPKPVAPIAPIKPVAPVTHPTMDNGGLVPKTTPGVTRTVTSSPAVGAKPVVPAKPIVPAKVTVPAAPAKPAAPPLTPATYGAPPTPYGTASVEDRVAGILSNDSPLMQAAQTEGMKLTNRRGMLNSSLTDSAVTSAMIDKALPIASQDASQAFQGSENQLSREQTDRGQIRDLGEQRYELGQNLEADRYRQAVDINQQRYNQAQDLNFRTKENQLDRATQEKLASWNLKSSDRNAAAGMLVDMENEYNNYVASIMGNTSLDAATRTKFLEGAKSLLDARRDFVQQMYNIKLDWPGKKAA